MDRLHDVLQYFLIILFIYLLFLAVLGLHCHLDFFSSCGKQELLSSNVRELLIARVLSGCRAWALEHMGFYSCRSQALKHRLSSCGARAALLHSVWRPPGPGVEPMSPALAGRFFTTEPPGRPYNTLKNIV